MAIIPNTITQAGGKGNNQLWEWAWHDGICVEDNVA